MADNLPFIVQKFLVNAREDVKIVLESDKGPTAVMKHIVVGILRLYYLRAILKVKVYYAEGYNLSYTSYVVKINVQPDNREDKVLAWLQFLKEAGAYKYLFPVLNAELALLEEPPLKIPKYFHSVNSDGVFVIYLEDMTTYGYTDIAPEDGFRTCHATIVIKELARLHAISKIFIKRTRLTIASFKEIFRCAKHVYLELLPFDQRPLFEFNVLADLKEVELLCIVAEGREIASQFIFGFQNSIRETYETAGRTSEPFISLIHGSVCVSNVLFR